MFTYFLTEKVWTL